APASNWSLERANSSRSVVYALRVLSLRLARKRSSRPPARATPSESRSPPFTPTIPSGIHSVAISAGARARSDLGVQAQRFNCQATLNADASRFTPVDREDAGISPAFSRLTTLIHGSLQRGRLTAQATWPHCRSSFRRC